MSDHRSGNTVQMWVAQLLAIIHITHMGTQHCSVQKNMYNIKANSKLNIGLVIKLLKCCRFLKTQMGLVD